MKRPAQAAFDFDTTVQAVAEEVTRVCAATDTRGQFDLPSDYGVETDWTPRVVPEDQREWWDEESGH